MLSNYFKIALKVLFRRKFFTFISLFGISFTLMVLMVVTAFMNNLISSNYPETQRDKSLYVTQMRLSHSDGNNNRTGPSSLNFLNKQVKTLKTAEKVAITSLFTAVNVYSDNLKLSLNMKHTNADFWDVMEFDFLEGKPYSLQDVENGAYVAVITDRVKREYFGDVPSVIGEVLEINNDKFRIIGVVRSVPITRIHSSADLFLPYSTAKSGIKDKGLSGMYVAIVLANSSKEFPAIEAEFQDRIAKMEMPNPKDFNQMEIHADTYLASWTRLLFGDNENSNTSYFYTILFIFMLLFMLLPAINLINVNSSRIMERASEIGVRKAFGASSSTLVYQFIIENIIITFIGGILGCLLAWIAIEMINDSGVIAHLDLNMNLTVLSVGVLLCLFFGFMSGVFPALKMSRLHVVNALKANEL